MSKHGDATAGNNHVNYNWTVANATARLALTGFVAEDVGKWCRQTDDYSYWELTSLAGAWTQIGGSGSVIALNIVVNPETSNLLQVNVQVQDAYGNDIFDRFVLLMWLANLSGNPNPTTSAPDTDLSLSDGAIIHELTADIKQIVCTDDNGYLTVDVEHTGAATWYLWFQLPNGKTAVSGAITFT